VQLNSVICFNRQPVDMGKQMIHIISITSKVLTNVNNGKTVTQGISAVGFPTELRLK